MFAHSEAGIFDTKIDVLFVSLPCDCLAGSPAELSDCRRSSGASPAVKVGELRRQSGSSGRGSSAAARQLSSGSTIHFSARAAGLPPSSPRRMCRTAAEALAAVRQLRQPWQLRRGELGGSPEAQLRENNPFFLHLADQYGRQRVKAKVPFPQLFSTIAEITPTTSLYLLWKYERHQTQSL